MHQRYQRQLLDQAQQIYRSTPISGATVKAYLATPRHLFVPRYREHASRDWQHVRGDNLNEHLATLYSDRPLTLCGEDDANVLSTISQPSFVLRMLDLLEFEPGQSVFELGAGSGWNAALIGQLVGPSGRVTSLEIIPELAETAAKTIATLGIRNVEILRADGGEGYAPGAPYDRATFTAGSYDLPRHFYEQIKDRGRLLAVVKNVGGGDNLFVLKRVGDHFESLHSLPCGFVQLTGKYTMDALDAIGVEELPDWQALQRREVARRPFWWGGKGREWFMWQTSGIRSFLGITEPLFRAFKAPKSNARDLEEHYFGLWDPERSSLVLARDDELIAYASTMAMERLLRNLHRWIDLGMPTAASFGLHVYRNGVPLTPRENQWVVRRNESQFLWSLETGLQ
jgi:protein-L-isoaspartate(D-aspartate) O-methyltransferase